MFKYKKNFSIVSMTIICLVALVLLGNGSLTSLKPDIPAQGGSTIYLPLVLAPPSTEEIMVKRFAPVLKLHSGNYGYNGLPMSAEVYFQNMMNVSDVSPVIDPVDRKIYWKAEDQPAMKAGRVELCGADFCEYGMSNGDFGTLTGGQVPTYYRVIYDDFSGRARIAYWWFYGWQGYCSEVCSQKGDGAHHGDWENILVTTTPDRNAIEAVTYYFHGSWYTRIPGGFEVVGERPVVYVGAVAHASYYSQECAGFGPNTPLYCCTFADYRDGGLTWDTSNRLVNLAGNSESWMLADRIGSVYLYEGIPCKIESWRWGPDHKFKSTWCDEAYQPGCYTHPTIVEMGWDLPSCGGNYCNGDGCPYSCNRSHDQGWPWWISAKDLHE